MDDKRNGDWNDAMRRAREMKNLSAEDAALADLWIRYCKLVVYGFPPPKAFQLLLRVLDAEVMGEMMQDE